MFKKCIIWYWNFPVDYQHPLFTGEQRALCWGLLCVHSRAMNQIKSSHVNIIAHILLNNYSSISNNEPAARTCWRTCVPKPGCRPCLSPSPCTTPSYMELICHNAESITFFMCVENSNRHQKFKVINPCRVRWTFTTIKELFAKHKSLHPRITRIDFNLTPTNGCNK